MKYIKTYENLSDFRGVESGQTDFVFSIHPGVAYIKNDDDYPYENLTPITRYNPPHYVWEIGYPADYYQVADMKVLRGTVASGAPAPYFLITSANEQIYDSDNYEYIPHVIVDSSWNCERVVTEYDTLCTYTNPRYNVRLTMYYSYASGEQIDCLAELLQ